MESVDAILLEVLRANKLASNVYVLLCETQAH